MKTKAQFKKEMRDFCNTSVNLEPDETFTTWFSALWGALEEEGKVIKQGGKLMVKD